MYCPNAGPPPAHQASVLVPLLLSCTLLLEDQVAHHHFAKNRNCRSAVMGQPSYAASNALIYLTYGAFLYDETLTPGLKLRPATDKNRPHRVTGLWIAWLWRGQSKKDFLANNRTQKGQIRSRYLLLEAAFEPPSLSSQTSALVEEILTALLAIPLALNFIASGECSGSVHDTRTSGSNPYDASHTCAYTALARRPVR